MQSSGGVSAKAGGVHIVVTFKYICFPKHCCFAVSRVRLFLSILLRSTYVHATYCGCIVEKHPHTVK